jgi:LmbE family N-acetylglucosaminyl deacetylase
LTTFTCFLPQYFVSKRYSKNSTFRKNPVFIYLEDRFQKPYPFRPDIAEDITSTFDKKIEALKARESQIFEWLP